LPLYKFLTIDNDELFVYVGKSYHLPTLPLN